MALHKRKFVEAKIAQVYPKGAWRQKGFQILPAYWLGYAIQELKVPKDTGFWYVFTIFTSGDSLRAAADEK